MTKTNTTTEIITMWKGPSGPEQTTIHDYCDPHASHLEAAECSADTMRDFGYTEVEVAKGLGDYFVITGINPVGDRDHFYTKEVQA